MASDVPSNRQTAAPTLSVIIPTLNEEHYLPRLLAALAQQTRVPDEVIVADGGSTDRTVARAQEFGARVVSDRDPSDLIPDQDVDARRLAGGRPARGRNAGARAARGDLLLFLDADVLPAPDFVEKIVDELERRRLGVATALVLPLSDRVSDRVLHSAANSYFRVVRHVSPRAYGMCILVRSNICATIGGFNESLLLAEDHDFVRRAAQHGNFGLLTSMRIPVSVRRLNEDRLISLLLKYLWAEANVFAGRPIHSIPFKYRFGQHYRPPQAEIDGSVRYVPWTRPGQAHLREQLSATLRTGALVNKMNTRLDHLRDRVRDIVTRQ